jgi:hypothetical protein
MNQPKDEPQSDSDLKKIGLESLGGMYRAGNLYLRDTREGVEFLGPFDDYIKCEDVVGIRKGERYGNFALEFYMLDEYGRTPFLSKSLRKGKSMGGKWPRSVTEADGSLETQLLSAGFSEMTEEQQAIRTFALHVDERGSAYDFLAMTEDGKLIAFCKAMKLVGLDLFQEGFKVKGIKELELEGFNEPEKVTGVLVGTRNDLIECVLISKYGKLRYESPRFLREAKPEEIGVKKVGVKEEATGYRVGDVNPISLLEIVPSINGVEIDVLETRMRPFSYSMSGFLGKNESLRRVLISDNETVFGYGLTHQDLSEPLKFARAFYNNRLGEEFVLRGNRFKIEGETYRGVQESPFEDQTVAASDVHVTNLQNGNTISFSLLLPDMVERYGFYEGEESHYRLDPIDVIEVFDYLKEDGKRNLEALQIQISDREAELS